MQRIGDYDVEGEIGRGAMGVVLRGRDGSGRAVAIKRLRPGLARDPSELARFRHEGEASLRLRHPHIVSLLDSGADASGPYQVLELVEGKSLQEVLRERGRLTPRRVAELGLPLARALEHAHQRGVLHRDLKPANVLLDRAGRPRLTDFGLAKLVDIAHSLTATGEILGTPLFMAPEQARGDRDLLGPPTDVYGLGATLYQALTGRTVVSGNSVTEVIPQILHQEPTPPSALVDDVDPQLEAILLRCLAKDPRERYPSAGELAEALERWLAGPLPTRDATPTAHRGVVALVTVLVGLALAVTLLALTRQPGEGAGPPASERDTSTSPDALARASREPVAGASRDPLPDVAGAGFTPDRPSRAASHPDPDLARLLELVESPQAGELAEAALLVSKLTLHPDLSVGAELRRLDALADGLRPELVGLQGEARARRLVALVYEQVVRGAEDATYVDPRNSCLDQVLRSGRGIQITCSLALLALGERLDVALRGVCFPGSFLLVSDDRALVIDAFHGRALPHDAVERQLLTQGGSPRLLEPAPRQLILVRLVVFLARNLVLADRRDEAARAERLVELLAPHDTQRVIDAAFGEGR